MFGKKNRTHSVRDDNLRLIFRRAILADLNERQIDILSGGVLVIIFDIAVIAAIILAHTYGLSGLGGAGGIGGLLFALLIGIVAVTALLSPVVLLMLVIEFIRVTKERRDFDALLKRYGRDEGVS